MPCLGAADDVSDEAPPVGAHGLDVRVRFRGVEVGVSPMVLVCLGQQRRAKLGTAGEVLGHDELVHWKGPLQSKHT